jgi:carbon-monoxide dehydrogenase large subunit
MIPSAAELPRFDLGQTVTPSPSNPLGVKGIGEAGTIAASAAIVNAAVDAVSHLGIKHLEMPLQPARVWQAMQKGGGA